MTSATDDLPNQLKTNAVDYGVAAGKSLLSIIPFAGGFASELLAGVIPAQRMDRVAHFLKTLDAEITELKGEVGALDAKARSGEQVLLFQTGGEHAARAATNTRAEQVAKVVALGMFGDDLQASHARRVLKLLDELGDDDVIQLCSYLEPYKSDAEWKALHKEVLFPPAYSQELRDRGTASEDIHRLATRVDIRVFRLEGLGLLEAERTVPIDALASQIQSYSDISGTGLARFGTGPSSIKAEVGDLDISYLGRDLLAEIGVVAKPAPKPSLDI
jgi:outer membrane murein-binding lipoprotein Lpp